MICLIFKNDDKLQLHKMANQNSNHDQKNWFQSTPKGTWNNLNRDLQIVEHKTVQNQKGSNQNDN